MAAILPKSTHLCQVFLILAILQTAKNELFTALVELEKVLHAEEGVAQDLRDYIAKEQDRLDRLKLVADDYERHSKEALKDTGSHLGNPVNAFLLVKRFTSDWEMVQNSLIRTNSSADFLNSLRGRLSNFPSYDDLDGAATALLRLQDTYKLSTENIAKGEIQGVKHAKSLSAWDCFSLGRIAYNKDDHYHTIKWMQEALHVLDEEENKTVDRARVLDYLAFSAARQGNNQMALKLTNEFLTLEPDHVRAKNNKRYYERLIEQEKVDGKKECNGAEIKNEKPYDEYRSSEEFKNYEALCRGENIIKYKYQHKLVCRYIKPHPFFILRPLKEEQAYLRPYIVMLHDIMTDTEIAKIKELAQPKLNTATVYDPKTGELVTASYRISKSAWLKDRDDSLIAKLSRKIDYFTGLSMETAEELQVVNYGIGGHYEPHFDFARKRETASFEDWRGNRIATVLFYMSDVEAGGATVFPYLGVKLFPEKGASAFWFNLLRSGEGDMETRHAACPVLTGSKWVSNKWVHERSQEFRRPCSTTPAD